MNKEKSQKEEGIKNIYSYLEKNKDKRDEETYKQLKKELKKTLLKNYQEEFISKEFFEEYNKKIKEVGKKTLKEIFLGSPKESLLPEIIVLIVTVGVLIMLLGFTPFERNIETYETPTTTLPTTTPSPTIPPTTLPPTTTHPPNEIAVDDDREECPNADYTSIQEAIDHAEKDYTIKVYSGVYEGNIVLDKKLKLIGIIDSYGSLPILKTKGDNTYQEIGIKIAVDGCTVKGFRIEGYGIGIGLYNSNENVIDNNTLSCSKGYMKSQYGIFLKDSTDNIIKNNTLSDYNEGIRLESSSYRNNVYGNDISNTFYGIYLLGSLSPSWELTLTVDVASPTNNDVTGNICSRNKCGIKIKQCNNNAITGNTLSENVYGIVGEQYETNIIMDNYYSDNITDEVGVKE